MLSYGLCLWVLLLSVLNVITVPVLTVYSLKVKLHDNATLPCTQTCSGLVTWTVSHKSHDILAQCNRTSCQSKEGFHMSHDQYLNGDLSLTITNVDFTKSTWYTCECDGVDIFDVSLQIEEVQPCPDQSSTVTVLAVLLVLMGVGLVAAVLVIVHLRKISSSRQEENVEDTDEHVSGES